MLVPFGRMLCFVFLEMLVSLNLLVSCGTEVITHRELYMWTIDVSEKGSEILNSTEWKGCGIPTDVIGAHLRSCCKHFAAGSVRRDMRDRTRS